MFLLLLLLLLMSQLLLALLLLLLALMLLELLLFPLLALFLLLRLLLVRLPMASGARRGTLSRTWYPMAGGWYCGANGRAQPQWRYQLLCEAHTPFLPGRAGCFGAASLSTLAAAFTSAARTRSPAASRFRS